MALLAVYRSDYSATYCRMHSVIRLEVARVILAQVARSLANGWRADICNTVSRAPSKYDCQPDHAAFVLTLPDEKLAAASNR